MDTATDMGSELLTEGQYRELQKLGKALFCDCRYAAVLFITMERVLTMLAEGSVVCSGFK